MVGCCLLPHLPCGSAASHPPSTFNAQKNAAGIFVYNDKGSIIATLNGGSRPKDGLVGYTGSTVSVRRGSTIYVYNANGHIISTVNAGR
jgi:hypothetical protein